MTDTEATDSQLDANCSQVTPPVTIHIPMPKGAALPLELGYGEALERYEEALSAMLKNRFDEAIPLLRQVVAGPNRALAERAQFHISTCASRVQRAQNAPRSDSEGK